MNNELYHHGIKGQKWGVRRYQNPDGTLTANGKLRYRSNTNKDPGFELAERNVISKLSNKYTKFNKQDVDISAIKERANLGDYDAAQCAIFATKKFKEASKIEPRITKDVVDSVAKAGCKMYGLEYRLKQPTSMAGKIGSDSKEKDISFQDATKGIKDAIRYTSVSDTKSFVNKYINIKKNLEQKGYSETRCKNFFEKYKRGESMHKSVQCTYRNKDGYEFELQFHTPASQAAKELKIPIYEERRKSGISDQRARELETQMKQLAENVKDPPNIYKIK